MTAVGSVEISSSSLVSLSFSSPDTSPSTSRAPSFVVGCPSGSNSIQLSGILFTTSLCHTGPYFHIRPTISQNASNSSTTCNVARFSFNLQIVRYYRCREVYFFYYKSSDDSADSTSAVFSSSSLCNHCCDPLLFPQLDVALNDR